MRRRFVAIAAAAVVAGGAGCASSDVSRSLGARCDDSNECDDQCLPTGPAYPGGMCTLGCDDDDDCPAEARCAAEEGGVCLFSCDAPVDCGFLGSDWTCADRAGLPTGQVAVCRGS